MKLRFKHQKFQVDAAKAVVDVFAGQPYLTQSYMIDPGSDNNRLTAALDFTGWKNQPIVPQLEDKIILEQLQKIQRNNGIKPSDKLEGKYNLTIEMETGVGKTYTYIKTMYELNKAYGWSKFIIVVPSIAIREGVYKTLEVTQEHFAQEYGKKIRFFIYDSSRLTDLDQFASDNSINAMVINSQAFNAKGKDARRIYMEQDAFRSRKPIEVIAATNPILIIDEPQSVEGKQTKENLKQFNPLLTLRYSATHRQDSIYNMVYRLDAIDAYNKNLVKKIAVKGISASGSTATESFLFLEGINLSTKDPTANLQFEYKGKTSVRQITRVVKNGDNLYDLSNYLEEYKQGFVVSQINGLDDSIEFINGIKIYSGDVVGKVNEDQIRRIQIRETILSHIERERELYYKGIKVLSLFFIDEVAKYKQYDEAGNDVNGIYADMFEQEYKDIISNLQTNSGEDKYLKYLNSISAHDTHAGYFSVDKKGKMVNSKVGRKETTTDDVDAYDLIMKRKELLLDQDRSPVRFIFSHSALREGWDNPNVFQICTLKQSNSNVRKRQEVGRGLRLCVNQEGERMDANVLGRDVHSVNLLTVIASESYDSFAKGLQTELAEAVGDRPRQVTKELFVGQVIKDTVGNEQVIDGELAQAIFYDLIINGYIDKKGNLTDKYYEDKANHTIKVAEEVTDSATSVINIIESVYDSKALKPENARDSNVELNVNEKNLAKPEFKALWNRINSKSYYFVDFDTDELVKKSIKALNDKLHVSNVLITVELGAMKEIKSKADLKDGKSFERSKRFTKKAESIAINSGIKYDLIGKLVDETKLTRKAIVQILQGISKPVFDQFKKNPEEFILKTSELINNEKATTVIEHITYNVLKDKYDTSIFTEPTIKGRLDVNAMKADKHLYDHIIYDSDNEKKFAEKLDTNKDVAVYVKLPDGFYISTPVGRYNPDWAIAFYEENIKHVYFIAETKGSLDSMQLRLVEESKIHCAREHFKAISNGEVVYDVIDNYETLLNKVMK